MANNSSIFMDISFLPADTTDKRIDMLSNEEMIMIKTKQLD